MSTAGTEREAGLTEDVACGVPLPPETQRGAPRPAPPNLSPTRGSVRGSVHKWPLGHLPQGPKDPKIEKQQISGRMLRSVLRGPRMAVCPRVLRPGSTSAVSKPHALGGEPLAARTAESRP